MIDVLSFIRLSSYCMSNHCLAFQLCRFSTFFLALPSPLYVSNVTVLSLFMNYVILQSYTYLFLMILFLLRTLLPNSNSCLFKNLLFNSSSSVLRSNISSLEKSPWPPWSSRILLFYTFTKMCFFNSVLYNFSINLCILLLE